MRGEASGALTDGSTAISATFAALLTDAAAPLHAAAGLYSSIDIGQLPSKSFRRPPRTKDATLAISESLFSRPDSQSVYLCAPCAVGVSDDCKMQPGSGSARPSSQPLAAGADAVDVPGRPDFVNVFQSRDHPIPATAVRAVTPERERRTARPDTATVYLPAPPPEMQYYGRCFAYAYITPADAACKADPAPFVRRAIHGVVPRARFELLGPGHGADRKVRFASPEDREAAMEKQPFALDGAEVRLVREGETSNVRPARLDCLAHVALLRYPKEQRNLEDIRRNCSSFGHLLEIDPDCYDAPDLSPVRVVVNMGHPKEIPREVRIRYYFDLRFRNVVPVQILRIWDRSQSTDAAGKYVPMYSAAAAVAP